MIISRFKRLVGLAFVAAAVVFLLFSSIFFKRDLNMVHGSGKVVGLTQVGSTDGDLVEAVVMYKHANGSDYVFRSRVPRGHAKYRIGNEVSVIYHPSYPKDARIGSFLSKWGRGLTTATLSVVSLLLALTFLRSSGLRDN